MQCECLSDKIGHETAAFPGCPLPVNILNRYIWNIKKSTEYQKNFSDSFNIKSNGLIASINSDINKTVNEFSKIFSVKILKVVKVIIGF